jgi:2-octaprenylphenol hydroxylase
MQMQSVDVVIVGGGMVGLGLAAALKESALKVVVVEGQLPDPQLGEVADNRVSALSLASQQILRHVGAWDRIAARRLQAYDKMAVWEQDSFGRVAFDAASLRQPELGHIVENRVIQLALLEAMVETTLLTLPELWQRIWHLPDANKIFAAAKAHGSQLTAQGAVTVCENALHALVSHITTPE